MGTIKNVWSEKGRIYMLSSEGKMYSHPLEAFPLLKGATEKQRMDYTVELHGEALRWTELDEDIHISSSYTKDEPKYDSEIAMLLKCFPQLDISKVARNPGINESLLSKYIYGIKNPSAGRVCQTKNTLRALERGLAAV